MHFIYKWNLVIFNLTIHIEKKRWAQNTIVNLNQELFNWKIPFYRNILNILEWKLKLKQYYNGTNHPQTVTFNIYEHILANKSEDARSIRSPSFPIARHSKPSLIFRLFYQAISTLRSSSATEVNRKIVTHRKS